MKLIIKMIPVNVYDIAKMESYLRSMAAKGYVVKKIGTFAHFEQTKPQKVFYRLEPLARAEKKPNQEQTACYSQFGWDYVCTIQNGFHVFVSYDEEPEEIHSDPIIQSYTFEYLMGRMKINWYLLPLLLLPIGMILYASLGNDQPLLYAVKYGQSAYMALVILSGIFAIWQVYQNRIKLVKLVGQLQTGISMVHSSSYRSNYMPYVLNTVLLGLSLLTLLLTIYRIAAPWEANLADYHKELPVIRLEQIENTPDLEILERERDGMDYNNNITYRWSELASEIYEIKERGKVAGRSWEDGSGEYEPSLCTEYFQLNFKLLARPLMMELMEDALEFHKYKEISVQELADTEFDSAILVKSGETQMLFAASGRTVIYVRYYGYEDLSLFIESIYRAVKEW